MLLATDGEVSSETVRTALPISSVTHVTSNGTGPLSERVQNFEREMILAELKAHEFHITNVAKALGLERSHLYKKAEQLGIDISKQRRSEE